jgi:hypothetical protein
MINAYGEGRDVIQKVPVVMPDTKVWWKTARPFLLPSAP